jgi:uncharacterized protein YjbI with pentapeptide repeats
MNKDKRPHLPINELLRQNKRLGFDKNYKFEDLRGRTFKNANFAGLDFTGADLSAAKFYSCNFEKANLSAAVLNGTLFEKCNMNDCKLIGTIKNGSTRFNECTGKPILIEAPESSKLKEGRYKQVMAKVLKDRKDTTPITSGAPVFVKDKATPEGRLRLAIQNAKKAFKK